MNKLIAHTSVAALCLLSSPHAYADNILQFSASQYEVDENEVAAAVEITVDRDWEVISDLLEPVEVNYSATDGTATDGSDYVSVSGTLTFPPLVEKQAFTIEIIDDVVSECDETVNLTLRDPDDDSTLDEADLIMIEDDQAPLSSLRFSASEYTVEENDTEALALITVTRDVTCNIVAVDYNTADADVNTTASAGSDYTAASGTLIFDIGVTSRPFTVGILDDAEYEGNETVTLSLSNPLPLGDADLGSPSTAELIIFEDEAPPVGSLQFSAPTYTVDENGAAASITVTRVDGSAGTVTVDYATSDDTAIAGADYTAVVGTLSFADGITSQAFTIAILDDADYEGNETVNLSLSNPTGGAGLGAPASAVLTIAEDEPIPPVGSLQFSAPTYLVTEFGVVATITVERVGGSVGTVSVDYASSDDTATAGEDYVAVNGSLDFKDGEIEIEKTFNVQIINDTEAQEGDESLDLILSNPTGGAGLGTPSTATLTITEKDAIFDGSGGGLIDLTTLIALLALYLRGFRKRRMTTT